MAVNRHQGQPRLITVEEYERMVHADIFSEDDRIELIEGQIACMAPIGATHAVHVNRLTRLLAARLAASAILSIQNPIQLSLSEPQPDLALLKPRADDYGSGHPTARDVLLVIEVADTSADYDRTVKIPLYGRNGIPEAWLIDLAGQVIEVYRGPNSSGYREKQTYASGDQLAPLALPDLSLAVAEILGANA